MWDGCRLKCDDFLQNYQLVLDMVQRYVMQIQVSVSKTFFLNFSEEPLEDEKEFKVVSKDEEEEERIGQKRKASPLEIVKDNKKFCSHVPTLEV